MSELIKVYTPVEGYTGKRNCGRKSHYFEKGVAEMPKEDAEFYVTHFGYLCPDLNPGDADKVPGLVVADEYLQDNSSSDVESSEDPDFDESSDNDSIQESESEKRVHEDSADDDQSILETGKKRIRFLKSHTVAGNTIPEGSEKNYKVGFSDQLIANGIAEEI